jgi:drug/metabolite transporter (DMT)-like permease
MFMPRGSMPTSRLLQSAAFLSVYFIWGSTYLAIRVAVVSMPPLLLAGTRYSLAGGLVYALMRLLGTRAPTFAEWQRASVSGLLMATLSNGLVTLAEQHVHSNLAALLIACTPLFVALLDWARPGGKRPTSRQAFGLALGFFGMLLLVGLGRSGVHPSDFWGALALVGAALGWALGILFTRHRPGHPNSIMASAQQMFAGGVALLCLALLRGEFQAGLLGTIAADAWFAFGYLTLFGSIIAFSAFTWLVSVSTPTSVSTVAYVNPVVAVALGWCLLGERLSAQSVWGGAAIVLAIIVLSRDGRARGGKPLPGSAE